MRRRVGVLLIAVPAAFLAWGLVDTVIKALDGSYVGGMTSTSLIILGMMAVVALVPIGIGWWMLTTSRPAQGSDERAGALRGSGRELLGWLLLVPGVVFLPLRLAAGVEGGLGFIGPPAVVLLIAGIWIVMTERRARRSERRQLTKTG